jgi:GH43 family beta-xylosidase
LIATVPEYDRIVIRKATTINGLKKAEDGETVIMIYHARDYKEIQGHELSDPNRATGARFVRWTESGFPDFRQNEVD